jgi:putative ABC transport system permease protein
MTEYLSDLGLDVRTAFRQLRRAPAVAAAAVLTLSVGIGATTAVFSFVAAVLSVSEPVDDMDRRLALWSRNRGETETKRAVSPGDFLDWRARATTVGAMVATRSRAFNLSGAGLPVRLSGNEVSVGYFEFFRWTPAAGRTFTEDDARPGAPRVTVLTDRFWRTQLASRPDIVGQTLRLDEEPVTVIGLLPPIPGSDGIFVPLSFEGERDERAARSLFVWGRLEDGRTIEQARSEMEALGAALETEHPGTNRGWTVNTRPLQEEFVGPQARLAFGMLFAMAVAVLLVGCVNIANLLLARGMARQGEMAVRMAIGAAGWRLIRQLFVESAALAVLGGLGSVLVARAVIAVLVGNFPIESPWVESGGVNARMLAVTGVTALLATFAAGLMPALASRRTSLLSTLHAGGRGGAGSPHRRAARLLVGAQVALAVMLLIVAGLMNRTIIALERLDPGFDVSRLLTARVALPERLPPAETARWFAAAIERAAALPGVAGAAAASRLPFAGSRFNPNRGLVIEGQPVAADQATFAVDYVVTPRYFATLQLPIRDGRDFGPGDGAGAPLVAVVSETLAKRYWPGRSPVGTRLRQGDEPPDVWRTVIGVVGDVRNDDADQPPLPYLYLPLAQQPSRAMSLVVRTAGDPDAAAPSLRQAIAELDPDQPLFEVRSMQAILDADLRGSVVLIQVLNAFAALALGLAGIGIWGVVSQLVAQRTREIGVRVALGATTAQVLGMIVRLGLTQVLAGLVAGVAMGLGVARLLRSVLFQVTPGDPLTLALTCGVLLTVALAALAAPARRAAKVDPGVVLRNE